jgi:hypothetical protein
MEPGCVQLGLRPHRLVEELLMANRL